MSVVFVQRVSLIVACSTLGACGSDSPQPKPAAAELESAAAPQPTPAAAPAPSAEVMQAMRELTSALREGDVQGVLRAFSQTAPWSALNTKAESQPISRVSYERLVQAIESEGELRDTLLGQGETSLRSYVSGPLHGAAWTALSDVQFAPDGVPKGRVWIAWRREGERWVVDTIAWPMR
jgi:hypothetical protein